MLLLFLLICSDSLLIELFSSSSGTYLTKQIIGSQFLVLQVSFDTNLLLVLDSSMPSSVPTYNVDASATFQGIPSSSELCWSLIQVTSTTECAFMYVSSSNFTCEGALSLETISIGSLTLKDVIFGRIRKESSQLPNSGILGMGPGALSSMYGTPLLETIISVSSKQDQGISAVIGICMKDEKGALHIGGFDSHYSVDDFVIFPLLYNNRISVHVTEIAVGTSTFASYFEARVDPGSPLIYLPRSSILQVIQALKEFYGEACQQALCEIEGNVFFGSHLVRPPQEFPQISISIGDLQVVLSGFLKKCSTDQYCSIIRDGGSVAIIGSPILQELYVVVDMENSKIGMTRVQRCGDAKELRMLNKWEQSPGLVIVKLAMMVSALVMILVIGW